MAEDIRIRVQVPDSDETIVITARPDATDEEIQSKVEEIKGQVQRRRQAESFGALVDTSPSERAFFPDRALREAQGRGTQEEADRLTVLDNAADAGVDVTTGLDLGIRARASLLERSPQAAVDFIDHAVRGQLADKGVTVPDEVPVLYNDTNTGELTYLRAFEREDGTVGIKPTLVDEGGPVSLGDIADLSGDVLSAAPEVAGAIGLGALGAAAAGPKGAVAGGAGGAATGAFAGTVLRRELAKELGVPAEIADRITDQDAFEDALVAAGFELAIPGATAAVRGMMNRRRFFDPDDSGTIAEVKANAEQVRDSLAVLKEQTGIEFQPTIATATGDPALLVAETNVRRRVVGKKSEAFAEAEAANKLASAKALERINTQASDGMTPSMGPGTTGPMAQDIVQRPGRAAEARVGEQEKSLSEMAETVDRQKNTEPFLRLQDDIASAKETAITNENNAWAHFRQQIAVDENGRAGVALRNPAGSNIRTVLDGIDLDSRRALLTQISKDQATLLKNAGFGSEGGGLTSELLDMRQLHHTLSWLNRRIRHADRQVDPDGFDVGNLRDLRDAIRTQITQDGTFQRVDTNVRNRVTPEKQSEIVNAFEAANAATRSRVDLFDNSTIQNVLETKRMPDGSTRFANQPENIAALVLKPGDPRAMADVLDVVGENLDVRTAMAGELMRHMRGSVFDADNRFQRGALNSFLDQFSGHMRLLRVNPEGIRNVADMDRELARLQRRSDQVNGALRSVYGRTLTGKEKYGGNLVKDILGDQLTTEQARVLKRRLSNAAPEVWQDVQRQGTAWLQNELTKSAGQVANTTRIQKLVTDHGERLQVLYGAQYVQNLKALTDAMALVERVGVARGTKREMTPPLLQMTRALMGPLSKKQRFITAAQKQRQRMADNAMHSIVSNPDNLQAYVRLAPLPADSVVRAQGLIALGIPEGFLEPEAQEALDLPLGFQGRNF